MAGPETRLVHRIRKDLLKQYPGAWLFKVHGSMFQAAGIPDLIGCIDGRLIGLEVKLPDGSYDTTALQRATLVAIQRAGGLAEVVTSPEEALECVSWHLGG